MMPILRFVLHIALIAGPAFYLGTVWQRLYGGGNASYRCLCLKCAQDCPECTALLNKEKPNG